MGGARTTPVGLSVALSLAAGLLGLAADAAARTRKPALAGGWYPEGRAPLLAAAHLLMRVARPLDAPPSRPVALVVPHAGWNFSGPVAAAAFRLLRPGDYQRVVVVGPSHHQDFPGYGLDEARAYRTPLGEVPLCGPALASLRGPHAGPKPAAFGKEHSIEVELPLLQAALGSFCLVPVLAGRTDPPAERAFAERLAGLDDGRTLFVFSSDFTHYGPRFDYQPFGPRSPAVDEKVRAMAQRAVSLVASLDGPGLREHLAQTGDTICGRAALATALELLPVIAPAARAVTLARYSSADLPGLRDDGSVSYASVAFLRDGSAPTVVPLLAPPRLAEAPPGTPALPAHTGERLVRLARAALETQLRGTDDLSRELDRWPLGAEQERRERVYVSLYRSDPEEAARSGRLRGCVGQPDPVFPLWYGTVVAAVDAALRDTRFEPVTPVELARLEIEVTVISGRRPASVREVEIGRHGLVLQKGDKGALFLPQVPLQAGWDLEQTLQALSEKAGLGRGAWRDGARLSTFTGQSFSEHR